MLGVVGVNNQFEPPLGLASSIASNFHHVSCAGDYFKHTEKGRNNAKLSVLMSV